MSTSNTKTPVPFDEFIGELRRTLKNVFYDRDDTEKFIRHRGFPATVLRDIMANNPFSVAIPQKHGGRGCKAKECLGILDTASYESLPLSLMFGINIGLFLEPVVKYGSETMKEDVFERFLNKQHMGGLMITEPNYGSDALNMRTTNTPNPSGYSIRGVKHWQGLTGMADYWLITSRRSLPGGQLAREIDTFVCDARHPEQRIHVEEYYNNMGLFPIPYGKNIIDIQVPESARLIPESTGLKLVMDLLHRSRFQFPGMAIGFIRRMLDDAIKHCTRRIIGGRPLMALDQVQHQVARIQSAFTISSAMCARSAEISGIENDLSTSTVEANTMKAYVTDLMEESAQTVAQLFGASGYKIESIASRGIVDSRPFKIFEGSNEMLYTQIAERVLKSMGKLKRMNLADFLKEYDLTRHAADYFESLTNFRVDPKLSQRKQVGLGKIISRIVSAEYVINMSSKGFRNDLTDESLETLKHEVAGLVSSFRLPNSVVPVEDYQEQSLWMDYC